MYSITPFTHGDDEAAPVGAGRRARRASSRIRPAPRATICSLVWTPGPANDLDRPTAMPYYDGGLYLMPGGERRAAPSDLVLIKNDPQLQRSVAARRRAVQRDARRRRTGDAAVAAERRNAARRNCPRERRTDSSARAASTSARAFRARAAVVELRRARRLQYRGERPEQQLGLAGRRRRQVLEQRHLGGAHRRHGADTHRSYGPNARAAISSAMRRSGCASSARSRCGRSERTASRCSIPKAIPTRASSRRFPPTRRSRSRCSTGTAWS